MWARLQLDFEQVKNLVDQLENDEKEKLARYLDDQTLLKKFREIRQEMKDIPLSFEEITEEVETVREEMYREGRQNT